MVETAAVMSVSDVAALAVLVRLSPLRLSAAELSALMLTPIELAALPRKTLVVVAVNTEVLLKVVWLPMRSISALIDVNSLSSAVACELVRPPLAASVAMVIARSATDRFRCWHCWPLDSTP